MRLRRNAAVSTICLVAIVIALIGSTSSGGLSKTAAGTYDRIRGASWSAYDQMTTTNSLPATNSLLSPPNSDGKRIPIAIALRIINISDIDEVTQRFQMVGYLIAEWKDPRLGFTPGARGEKFRTYTADEIWSLRFDFVNGVVPHSAYDSTIRVFADGTVRYSERCSAELSDTFRFAHVSLRPANVGDSDSSVG